MYCWTHAYRIETMSHSLMLCCQLCSTHYTAVQINNCLKRTNAKYPLWKLQMISVMNGSHHVPTTLFMVSKDKWVTKEGTGKHCVYSGMAKGTSWAVVMLSIEKNQACSLNLKVLGRQLVNWSVSQLVENSIKNFFF